MAPELDQSGVSHSLSLNDPLRLREIGPRHFAVRGTPTDCVIMGAHHILKPTMPDIVLSGVNRGRNVAEDVVYSGTIAGALEGTILGLPSFALSQEFSIETRGKPLWETALKFGPPILRKVIEAGIPRNTVINVNFPACPPEQVAGIRVTRQGKRNLGFLKIDERRDGRGNPYFWIGFERAAMMDKPAEGTDLAALAARYVSVTPLRLDRTDEAFSDELSDLLKYEGFILCARYCRKTGAQRFPDHALCRRALERAVDHLAQRLQLERLLQRRAVAIFLRQARRSRSRSRR